ncbi:outer membrane protein assembly factor BamA [bacterium SCSIO 12696]|nr:outer membrane protein assembly factor BamA [bacterium SCSIO 12696]
MANLFSAKRWVGVCLALGLFSGAAYGKVFEVRDIDIQGLQRVSAGKVFASFPISVGDLVDEETLRQAARSLFKTGNFEDIAFSEDNGRLVVRLKERPAVESITIDGSKKIPEEQLLISMRDNGLAEGRIFKRDVLDGIAQSLKGEYAKNGLYGSSVEGRIEPLPRNRVAVFLDITEGKPAAIKHINIVGNETFDEEVLREDFELTTSNWLSWFRNDDKYSREKLQGDLERLESFYKDRGYLGFNVKSTQVSVSPDKKSVYLTVNIEEGDIYTVSEIALSGDLVIPEEQLRFLIVLQEDKTYSQSLADYSVDLITRRLGNDGYTFAEVQAVPELNREDSTAKVTIAINPKKRVYVRRINIRGNTKTADDVVRREMLQMEGAVASNSRIEGSKLRLQRTAFVKRDSIEVDTPEVPGVDDQVDVNFSFEEQPSGQIGAQFGFSQTSGLQLGGNLSESNFLGTGKTVGFALNRNDFQKSLSISYTDPYFTVDGVSAGFSVFARESDFSRFNLSGFNTENQGINVNFSYPLSNTQRLSYGFGYEFQQLGESTTSAEVLKFVADNGFKNDFLTLNFGWLQSTLNSSVFATSGARQNVGLEISPPGVSDLSYYRLTYSGQKYFPLGRWAKFLNGWSLRLRTELGYGDGLSDTERLPFYKNFFGGGFNSIRGFERNTLGPRSIRAVLPVNDTVDINDPEALQAFLNSQFPGGLNVDNTSAFGGNVSVEASAEVIFPLPFIKDQSQVQASFFVDAGNIFDTECTTGITTFDDPRGPLLSVNGTVLQARDQPILLPGQTDLNCFKPDVGELRYSFGLGATWLSGFGPITFSISKPFNAGPLDEEESFQFSLGNQF